MANAGAPEAKDSAGKAALLGEKPMIGGDNSKRDLTPAAASNKPNSFQVKNLAWKRTESGY